MKRCTLIAMFISLGASADNLNKWQESSVKTWSYPCQSQSPKLEGSGLIVQGPRGIEILTSEHVVIQNSSEDICHEVENSKFGVLKTKLSRVSYLYGMAVLVPVESNSQIQGVSMDKIDSKAISAETLNNIIALGTPSGSQKIQVLDNGQVVSLNSNRAFIPGGNKMGEFTGLPAEFGMSGGTLIGQTKSGEFGFVGMLSHQVLKRQGGQATKVVELKDGQVVDGSDLTLGILGSDVKKWLESGATDPMDKLFKRSLNQNGKEGVDIGPFKFDISPMNSNLLQMGGTDVNGIGGDGQKVQSVSEKQILSVSLRSKSSKDVELLTNSYPFLKKWHKPLLAGKKVSILHMAKRLGNGNYVTTPVASIDQVMTLWMRDSYSPVVYVGDLESLDSEFAELSSISLDCLNGISEMQKKFSKTDKQMDTWLNKFSQTIQLVGNGIATQNDLQKWLSENQSSNWDKLYLEDFDNAVALNAQVLKLIELRRF